MFFPISQKWHIGIIGIRNFVNIIFIYRPREQSLEHGNVFRSISLSTRGGVSVWCYFLSTRRSLSRRSLSRWSLLRGLCQKTPPARHPFWTVKSGWNASYWNTFLVFNETNSISCHALQTWTNPLYCYLISILQFPHGQLTAARRRRWLLAALFGQHRCSTALVLNPIASLSLVSFYLISLITRRKLTFIRFLKQIIIFEKRCSARRKLSKNSSFS